MSQRPSFKSPIPSKAALRALPHSRPRTVAAVHLANPSLDFRPYGCCEPQSFSTKPSEEPIKAIDRSQMYKGEVKGMSSSPARSIGDSQHPPGVLGRFQPRGEGRSQFMAVNAGILDDGKLFYKRKRPDLRSAQDAEAGFEYTFQPMSGRNQAEAVLKNLVHEHNQLKARVMRQEEVITELYGAQAPALRLLTRGSTAKPQCGSVAGTIPRRSGSSLSGNQLRPPRPEPSLAFDEYRRIADRRPSFEPGILQKTDSQNLDSVGKSLFLYPSAEGVFVNKEAEIGSERVATTVKRHKSAPRPSRFPKDVFPMVITRHRPTLD